MNKTRQDAWTKDEDIVLAETVLRYIREGRTQLEAFKEVAEKLKRTSAACGFRWNASLRKRYQHAIHLARQKRKESDHSRKSFEKHPNHRYEDSLEQAIQLLKHVKVNTNVIPENIQENHTQVIQRLRKDNERLKQRLARYEAAWKEMGKLWDWIGQENMDQ